MRSRVPRRIAMQAAAVVIIAVVAWLFARALFDGWERVQQYEISADIRLVAAAVLFAVAVAASGVLWGRVLRALSPAIAVPVAEAVRSHLAGWVMRYIPGVGSFLYKVRWAQKRGVSRTITVVGFTYESIFLQIASILGGALVLIIAIGPSLFSSNGLAIGAMLTLLVVLTISVSPTIVRPLLRLVVTRRLREKADNVPLLPMGRSLVFAMEFIVPRAINGVAIALIAQSIFGSSARDLFAFAAAYAIAGAVGILAVFVPGGLGVREGVFVAILLAAGFNSIDAIVLAVVARLVSTLADVLIAMAVALLTIDLRRNGNPTR